MTSIQTIVLKSGITSIAMPDSAEIVGVGFNSDFRAPAVYYLKRSDLPETPFCKRTFLVVATCEFFENKYEVVYLGSCIAPGGDLTLHVLEIING
jgi:hypothetical protein